MVAKAAVPHFAGSDPVSGSNYDAFGRVQDFAAAQKKAQEIIAEIRLMVRASHPVLSIPASLKGATAC
jgi:hypothetical protein